MAYAQSRLAYRNAAIRQLHYNGEFTPKALAGGFKLNEKQISRLLRRVPLTEGIIRTRRTPDEAFASLSQRASNRLSDLHINDVASFRKWWRSAGYSEVQEHIKFLHRQTAYKCKPHKFAMEVVQLAVELGLPALPPLESREPDPYPRGATLSDTIDMHFKLKREEEPAAP
jgi:hypothetical protein